MPAYPNHYVPSPPIKWTKEDYIFIPLSILVIGALLFGTCYALINHTAEALSWFIFIMCALWFYSPKYRMR